MSKTDWTQRDRCYRLWDVYVKLLKKADIARVNDDDVACHKYRAGAYKALAHKWDIEKQFLQRDIALIDSESSLSRYHCYKKYAMAQETLKDIREKYASV